jgi:hypothetical protein
MVLASQQDLARAAGVQQDSVGDAGEALQHDDLEGKGSDSVRKKNAVKPVVLLTRTGMTPDGSTQWKASLMQSKNDFVLLNKTKVLSGGIVSPVRASKRNASTSELDSLEKATKLKMRKNMDSSSIKGKKTTTFF